MHLMPMWYPAPSFRNLKFYLTNTTTCPHLHSRSFTAWKLFIPFGSPKRKLEAFQGRCTTLGHHEGPLTGTASKKGVKEPHEEAMKIAFQTWTIIPSIKMRQKTCYFKHNMAPPPTTSMKLKISPQNGHKRKKKNGKLLTSNHLKGVYGLWTFRGVCC